MNIKKIILNKNLLITLFCIFIIFFLFKVQNILLPFIIGIFLAYCFKDLVSKYEKNISRHWFSIIIVSIVSAIIILSLLFVIPSILRQLVDLSKQILSFLDTFNLEDFYNKFNAFFKLINIETSQELIVLFKKITGFLIAKIANMTNYIFTSSFKFFNIIFMIILSPIVGFYFLRDWKIIMQNINKLFPKEHRENIITVIARIDNILHQYIIGQINVSAIIAIIYSTLLIIIKFKYAFIVGIITGFLTLLPYIGAFGGCIIALFLGFFQFGTNYIKLLEIVVVFVLGQFLEGNFVTPNLIGNKIQVHPLWIMFAMFSGGSLYGFWGIVISMPVAAIIGVLIRFYFEIINKKTNKENGDSIR